MPRLALGFGPAAPFLQLAPWLPMVPVHRLPGAAGSIGVTGVAQTVAGCVT